MSIIGTQTLVMPDRCSEDPVINPADDGVFLFGSNTLRLTSADAAAAVLLCGEQRDVVGAAPWQFSRTESRADYCSIVATLRQRPGRSLTRCTMLVRRTGSDVPVETVYRLMPLNSEGGGRWVLAVVSDITKRLAVEVRLNLAADITRQAEQFLAISDERERIGAHLRDTVICQLFAAGLQLQAIAAIGNELVRDRIEESIEDLDRTIRDLRASIFALHRSASAMDTVATR